MPQISYWRLHRTWQLTCGLIQYLHDIIRYLVNRLTLYLRILNWCCDRYVDIHNGNRAIVTHQHKVVIRF
ncbi:hypothetical protein D3C72_1278530 [compost metagenome]